MNDPHTLHQIGKTMLRVSALGLGTAPLGGLFAPVGERAAADTIERAWSLGLRFFDTAPQYGNGLSERRLGAFLRTKPRHSFVLATKVGRLLRVPATGSGDDAFYKGTPPERPVFDFSHDGVLRSVQESLDRLGLDRIDILHLHDPDDHYEQAVGGAYRALDRLRAEGTVGAIGAGMNQSGMLARFARARAFDCFLLAGRYTLLEQGALEDLLPLCVDRGISIVAGGVYNSGLLADPRPGAKFNYEDVPPALLAQARRLADLCRSHGVDLKAAAIQFPSAHPAVASVLTGPRTTAELDETVSLFRQSIPAALWTDLKQQGLLRADAPTPSS